MEIIRLAEQFPFKELAEGSRPSRPTKHAFRMAARRSVRMYYAYMDDFFSFLSDVHDLMTSPRKTRDVILVALSVIIVTIVVGVAAHHYFF